MSEQMRIMRSKELPEELRDRIVARHRSGQGYKKNSAALKVPKSTVASIILPYLYIYILSRVLFHSFYCFYVIIMFYFFICLHFPLSGPVLINISLPIIPCMIVYVTNNKEP